MTDQETEQITAPPKEETPVKIKDPRRVAAGKALAARNKAAREAKKQAEADPLRGGFSLNGIMQVAAVVGAGFTLYHGYQVVKPYLNPLRGGGNNKEAFERPLETVYTKPKPMKTATPPTSPAKNEIKGIDME